MSSQPCQCCSLYETVCVGMRCAGRGGDTCPPVSRCGFDAVPLSHQLLQLVSRLSLVGHSHKAAARSTLGGKALCFFSKEVKCFPAARDDAHGEDGLAPSLHIWGSSCLRQLQVWLCCFHHLGIQMPDPQWCSLQSGLGVSASPAPLHRHPRLWGLSPSSWVSATAGVCGGHSPPCPGHWEGHRRGLSQTQGMGTVLGTGLARGLLLAHLLQPFEPDVH